MSKHIVIDKELKRVTSQYTVIDGKLRKIKQEFVVKTIDGVKTLKKVFESTDSSDNSDNSNNNSNNDNNNNSNTDNGNNNTDNSNNSSYTDDRVSELKNLSYKLLFSRNATMNEDNNEYSSDYETDFGDGGENVTQVAYIFYLNNDWLMLKENDVIDLNVFVTLSALSNQNGGNTGDDNTINGGTTSICIKCIDVSSTKVLLEDFNKKTDLEKSEYFSELSDSLSSSTQQEDRDGTKFIINTNELTVSGQNKTYANNFTISKTNEGKCLIIYFETELNAGYFSVSYNAQICDNELFETEKK